MAKLEEFADEETIAWLLDKENPSVRYFALQKLLGYPDDNAEVLEARREIMRHGLVPAILSRQHKDGYWGEAARFYVDKYCGSAWQLMILAELGADPENAQVRQACEFLLENSQDSESHGFSVSRSERAGGGRHSEVIPCLTGNMVWSLIRLGRLADPRVEAGIEWICHYQRSDDGIPEAPSGWPYDKFEICFGKHSCHMGVVKSLKALSAIPPRKRGAAVKERTKALAEYLLQHHVFRKSHDMAGIARPGWLKLGFPLMYQTDILEILTILTDLGYRDPRMDEALEIVRGKGAGGGRWKLENSFNGKMLENIESKGKDSKWITLKALSVIMGNATGQRKA